MAAIVATLLVDAVGGAGPTAILVALFVLTAVFGQLISNTATALVEPAISSDPAIYPDAQTRQRLYASQILSPKLERLRSRTWIKIKSGL